MKTKRVVFTADEHCGSVTGLTPPDWWEAIPSGAGPKRGRGRFANSQRERWNWYISRIKALQPIDILVKVGDAIDGKGERSGGTELITADRNEQIDMAAACIKPCNAKKVVIIYGTGYHTGDEEDFEDTLADKVGAEKIGGHEYLDVNGCVFDVKHFVGASNIPHGRHTAISREHMWNLFWAEHGEFPRADVIIRAHTHYFNYCGGYKWLGMTLPALQGPGSKYGVRKCSGTVDFGMVAFDVESRDKFSWSSHIVKVVSGGNSTLKF